MSVDVYITIVVLLLLVTFCIVIVIRKGILVKGENKDSQEIAEDEEVVKSSKKLIIKGGCDVSGPNSAFLEFLRILDDLKMRMNKAFKYKYELFDYEGDLKGMDKDGNIINVSFKNGYYKKIK